MLYMEVMDYNNIDLNKFKNVTIQYIVIYWLELSIL